MVSCHTLTVVQEYRIHNADVLFREDASVDQLIDVIEGLGFGVWGLGFGIWGLGFRFWLIAVIERSVSPPPLPPQPAPSGNRKYIRCLYVYNKIDCTHSQP